MRAVRIHDYGGVEELRFEDIPIPTPKGGEVLVKIYASSVNPIDWRIRSGNAKARLPVKFPITLGCDFSGVVTALGAGADGFAVGDEVFGYCGVQRDGTYADFIALPAADVALRPRSLSMLESAAIPLGALTAYIAMFEFAELAKGQSVLIHAAAGGVGSMAVQLAKHAGVKVFATGSAQSAPLIRSLGADVTIDYAKEKFEDLAREMDVVLDGVGGETQTRSLGCLRPGGYLAALVNPPDLDELARRGLRGARCAARPEGAILAKIAAMADEGSLRPITAQVLDLDNIREAHRLSETGHIHGKIVLRVA